MQHDDALRERLASLEREVLSLRRALNPAPEALPTAPFDVLEVEIGGEGFGIAVAAIEEILQPVWCRPIPDAPAWVLGAFQYGTAVVPAVDVERRLFGRSAGLTPRGHFVLVRAPALTAFSVGAVRSISNVEPQRLAPPGNDVRQAAFLTGMITHERGAMLPLMSLERLAHEFVVEPAH